MVLRHKVNFLLSGCKIWIWSSFFTSSWQRTHNFAVWRKLCFVNIISQCGSYCDWSKVLPNYRCYPIIPLSLHCDILEFHILISHKISNLIKEISSCLNAFNLLWSSVHRPHTDLRRLFMVLLFVNCFINWLYNWHLKWWKHLKSPSYKCIAWNRKGQQII